jgi:hypothetical protein
LGALWRYLDDTEAMSFVFRSPKTCGKGERAEQPTRAIGKILYHNSSMHVNQTESSTMVLGDGESHLASLLREM